MKIIITGGAGFIASHVADAYIKADYKVVIIDNLSTGFRKNVHRKAKFYKADIRDRAAIDRIFKKEKPEIVNHHAAVAEVVKSLRDPIPTLDVNVLGTTNVLLAFGNYGRGKNKKFIFSSTGGAIYSEPKKIPADETAPAVPLSPYGLSKLLGEEMIKFYARQYDFRYFIFRYPNVYGPRQNPKGEAGVVAIFGGLIRAGRQPTIFGDGIKTRDYVFVADIAHANLMAIHKGTNETVNLGWGREITDQMIFKTIAEALNYRGKPIYAPYRRGEMYRSAIKAEKAKKILGWSPRIALAEGIRKTVASL